MTDLERGILQQILETAREETKADYRAAGAPFGPGRGMDIWVEYGELTTVN